MWIFLKCIFVTIFLTEIFCKIRKPETLIQIAFKKPVVSIANYVFWPNATVPFYVNPDNFDHEQSLLILQALSMFAFRTCIKFAPVMASPASNEHVLVLENPSGIRRCVFNTMGHSVFEPHRVVIGYDCLQSPQIDMIIMRALGFPFEHNRSNRGIYIEVLDENIEPGATILFTKEASEPIELRAIPYDMNSAMHFGPRDFSKNGHRTILFKDHTMQQSRLGLTKLDLKKIEAVYGPECRARDRQEKIDLCQSYPGVARKKRDLELELANPESNRPEINRVKRDVKGLDNVVSSKQPEIYKKKRNVETVLVNEMSSKQPEIYRKKRNVGPVLVNEMSSKQPEIRKKRDAEIVTKSLRVNPEITPPPDAIKQTLTELGIDDAVQDVVEQVYKVSALALNNAREKYCNNTKSDLRTDEMGNNQKNNDILGIIELIAHYAQGMVEHAVANLTTFCQESETIEIYQRARCGFYGGGECRQTYKSTKSGNVRYSTQHRPTYYQSTNIRGYADRKKIYARATNDSEEITTESIRKKRDVDETKDPIEIHSHKDNEHGKHIDTEQIDTKEHVDNKAQKETNKDREKEKVGEKELDRVDKKNKEEKHENGDERVEGVMRAGTGIPILKSHRYEADRRRSRRSRAKYPIDEEDMDRSSLSMENDTPQNHRQSDEQKHHSQRENKEKHYRQREKIKEHHKQSTESDQSKLEMSKQSDELKQRESTEETDLEEVQKYEETTKAEVKKKRTKKRENKREYKKEIEEATETYQHKKVRQIPDIVKLSKENLEFYNDRKWPGGVVRYIIQEDTTYDTNNLRRRLAEVNRILKSKTCVRLKEITEEQAKHIDDYIVIDNSPDYVTGRVGGRQNFGSIELFRGDQHRQHTAMMVMAMLGFYFEVSRHDRDKFVRVHSRHVRPDKLHHFEKIRSDATLPLPYDYASATHPAWQYWRHLGRTAISTVATYKQQDPDGSVMKSFGQNSKLLSDIDIVKINSVYGNKCLNTLRTNTKDETKIAKTSKSKHKRQNGHATVAL